MASWHDDRTLRDTALDRLYQDRDDRHADELQEWEREWLRSYGELREYELAAVRKLAQP